ncbi:MAG: hypothetical protein ACI7YS_18150 [Flavobacterium sp.]
MKWYWKTFIGLCSLILLIIVLNIGLNVWIKYQLPKIINRKNDSAYHITYKNLKVSLWDSHILAREIVIVPKTASSDTLNKAGIYTKIHTLEVSHFKIWDLFFSNKIKAKSITIEHPELILYKKKEKTNLRESVATPFEKIITVSDIFLHHGDLKIIHGKNNKAVLHVQNINLQIDGILITDKILHNKIPFEFRNYTASCDSLYYHPNPFYHIRTKKIKVSKTDLNINHFEMIPEYSRREFVAKIPKERDIYTLLCRSIEVTKMNWGFKTDDFFFHCNVITLNNASANIYRSKIPPDNLKKKHLYNKMLRDLKFDLKVDTLKTNNSIVEYEQEKSFDIGAGKLIFNSFNLTASSICSGFKKEKLPDLKIKVKCRFMNTSPLDVNWKLNVMDKTDGFNINGTLTEFDVKNMVRFTKPHINVTPKGIIDEVHFNFTGNDKRASGEFAIKYDDLKFTVYQKNDRKKKNKLLTFAAKVFVKKDTKNKVKNVHIEVERNPEKSFFNLLWISIAEGLKKTLV